MDVMSQLLDAKLASGGQQWEKEESSGTGREAAHNYSVGTGRASPTADTGYGITAVGAAVATEASVHNRIAASEPTRPADDNGRRPDVPAAWPQRSTCTAVKLENYISQVSPHTMGVVML